jgi:hypothetical protein
MTKIINAAVIIYGAVCAYLGAQAYFAPSANHKPHLMSLIGGVMLGGLMFSSYFLWKSSPRNGRFMSLGLAVLAILMFAPRAIKGAMYPNGYMVILSVILIILLGAGHMMANKGNEIGSA